MGETRRRNEEKVPAQAGALEQLRNIPFEVTENQGVSGGT